MNKLIDNKSTGMSRMCLTRPLFLFAGKNKNIDWFGYFKVLQVSPVAVRQMFNLVFDNFFHFLHPLLCNVIREKDQTNILPLSPV